MCSGVVVVESRRRRFVSINRVLSQDNETLIIAICEEGRAWWLVVGPENAPYNWSELRQLPEIEVEVAEQPAAKPSPTAEPSPAAEVISNLLEQMQEGSLTLAQALAEFRDRSPVFEPTPTPEAAPVATDEELLESAAKALGYKHIPSDETYLTAEAGELLVFARAVLARWARPAAPAPAPAVVPVVYDAGGGVTIHRTRQDPEAWAVRRDIDCLALDGTWSYEPKPSSRTEEWLARHRFASAEAAAHAIPLPQAGEVPND